MQKSYIKKSEPGHVGRQEERNGKEIKKPFEGCILVDTVIRTWSARKIDTQASRVVSAEMQASSKAGKYTKTLVVGSRIDNVNRQAGRIRSFVYKETLPWGSGGLRIMPTSRFMDFSVEINERIKRFEDAVDELVGNMAEEIDKSRRRLGRLFDICDYPGEAELRSKYAAIVSYQPVPDSGDFRVDMPADILSDMEAKLERRLEDARKTARDDIVDRLRLSLRNALEKLSDSEAIFRDSLVRNIGKALSMGDSVDWLGEDLSSVVSIAGEIASVSPDSIRNDDAVRSEVVSKASTALRNLEAIFA